MNSRLPARPRARNKSCKHPGLHAVIYFRTARVRHHSRRTTLIGMNAFFARRVTAMRDWWHRNLQSVHYGAVISQAASEKGNWSCFFSAAHSAPAPMIPRTTVAGIVNTGTGAAMGVSKAKPSIVRVIRIRHRRPAGEVRFLGEFAGRKIANR